MLHSPEAAARRAHLVTAASTSGMKKGEKILRHSQGKFTSYHSSHEKTVNQQIVTTKTELYQRNPGYFLVFPDLHRLRKTKISLRRKYHSLSMFVPSLVHPVNIQSWHIRDKATSHTAMINSRDCCHRRGPESKAPYCTLKDIS